MSAPAVVIIITRQVLANSAASRWREQYAAGQYGLDKLVIADQLDALGPNPNPDDIDAVIGNTSWTSVPVCDNCGVSASVVVMVGEPMDYESSTARLCRSCVQLAAEEMDRVGGAA